jgi:NADPH:quinone reductase-like Zn-dependent oxidoreductase
MKAVKYDRYGPPEVVTVIETSQPEPGDNELLVRVHETIVTPTDVASRKGEPFAIRFFSGLTRPKAIAGSDFAGEVVAVGRDVTRFAPGDRVVGAVSAGAHAEYVCVAEDGVVTLLPAHLDYQDVAGVCDAGLTAQSFLRDIAKVQTGQTVLINGASGAVGQFGVQLARQYGAHVTGVCSGKNLDLVRSLGADRVIDYTQQDFAQLGDTYDVIFDAVGKRSFTECRAALNPAGLYLTTVPTGDGLLQTALTRFGSGPRAIFAATGPGFNQEKLVSLMARMEAGDVRVVVDRVYALADIAAAHRYVESGRKTGAVVIELAPSGCGEGVMVAEDGRVAVG